jgi:hypothetical protein
MIKYATRRKFRILLTDLHAARWVNEFRDQRKDQVLVTRFLSIHQFFLKNLGKNRPGLLSDVDRSVMATVVRGWMELYQLGIDDLRRRYPRTMVTPDLVAEGTNWSAELDMSFDGLLGIDFPSRYAEFWAERSIRDRKVFESYEARRDFIASFAYRLVEELVLDDQLLVVDDLTNGITAFDLMEAIRPVADDSGRIGSKLEEHGWHVMLLTPVAASALARAGLTGG